MNAKAAILLLLNGLETGLTRKQIAERANVNAGQLSTWLKNTGPLGIEREGLVAQACLHAMAELKAADAPVAHDSRFGQVEKSLVGFVPYQLLLARAREAAGVRAISPDNPCYVRRGVDGLLETRLSAPLVRLCIEGGTRTGKSSLLLQAHSHSEGKRSVIIIDCTNYSAAGVNGQKQSVIEWFAAECQNQLSGDFPAKLDEPDSIFDWCQRNILYNSTNNKTLILLDNYDKLARENDDIGNELDALILLILKKTVRLPWLDKLGIIITLDPASARITGEIDVPEFSAAILGRFDKMPLDDSNFEEKGVRTLLERNHIVSDAEALSAWRSYHGQPYLTQSYGLHRDMNTAIAEIVRYWETTWSTVLKDDVWDKLKNFPLPPADASEDLDEPDDLGEVLVFKSNTHANHLLCTGLFFSHRAGNEKRLTTTRVILRAILKALES